MKNEVKTGRTLEVVLAEANAKVDLLNKEKDFEKRLSLEVEIDKLAKEYNSMSLLTAHEAARAQELPIIALAKACTYKTISKKGTPTDAIVDGVTKKVTVFSISEKDSNLNVLKFIKWLQDRNFKMPKDWIKHMSAVKADVIDQWQAFDKAGDEHTFKIGQLKRLLQPMVDDMGFIKGKNGNNALVAKGEHAKIILKFANRKTSVQSGDTLTPKIWDELLMTVLNSIATDTAFANTYGSVAVYHDEPNNKEETEEKPEEKKEPEKKDAKKKEPANSKKTAEKK